MTTISDKNIQSRKVHNIMITETKIRIKDPKDPLLEGKYSSVLIRNYKDNKNSNSTTATFYDKSSNIARVLTSDATVQLIGQNNYDYLYLNLLNLREFAAIVSLLTSPKITTVWAKEPNKTNHSVQSSTEPVFTHSNDITKKLNIVEELSIMLKCKSVDSILSKVGHLIDESKRKSILLMPNIECNCRNSQSSNTPAEIKNNSVPDSAENVVFKAMDGSNIILPFKPKDLFHIATPEIIKNYTTKEEKYKLQCLQAVFDWRLCTKANDEGYLPIHIAASENDVDLIKRHGAMLKAQGISIDVNNETTPLHLAITSNKTNEATKCLLKLGADLSQKNNKEQNLLHIAATSNECHMKAIIAAIVDCTSSRRPQRKRMHNASDLSDYSRNILSTMALETDIYGDTPLMLACREGNLGTIDLLVQHFPETMHIRNPSSGNTALHVAMCTALKHFEELKTNNDPSGEMLLKREEILSMLSRLIRLCNTQVKNFNNLTPVDLLNQSHPKYLVSFVADQLNNKNLKIPTYKIPIAKIPIATKTNSSAANNTPAPFKKLMNKPNETVCTLNSDGTVKNTSSVLIENGMKLITSIGNPKITVLPIKPTPATTTKITRKITIKRNSTITKLGVRQQSNAGHPNNIILVSDDRNNIAGVLTKVNFVNPPPLNQINTSTNATKPKVIIKSNKLLNPPNPNNIMNTQNKPKTFIVKINPQDNVVVDNQKMVILKRKLPMPASADNRRSLLKMDNT